MKKTRKRRLGRGVKLLIIVIILLIIGGIWQNVMMKIELRKYSPKGQLYHINSHNIHLYGVGQGRSTVVFIAGSGTPSAYTDFYYLQSKLQTYSRTISFDHAGFGWSEKTSIPRTIDTVVEELHELLQKAGEKAPYILVGHSLASLEAIRYAQKYPNEVKGILLLDGGSPEFYAKDSEMKSYFINRFFAGFRVTGVARALGAFGVLLPFSGENIRYKSLPDELKSIDIAMYYNRIGESSNISTIRNINENAQSVIEGGYLKDIPLLILSSDSGGDWEDVQKQLIHWSNQSHQETLPNSKHYIHWSNQKR
ncbi:alpha/beta hydrolase [Paenibacillus dendritiformis]|uniref:alpha/beta fold hydrolase n=1 Tax=Paenibacillus dendritiformis TaxID=130049 RepID=UPI00143CFC31|nr:alpha/beta hydrolase [Paenibacillus dendritiformis]NKI20356.1 alpha/beta hydrolase [Paenibacillus dendritiformis]NRF98003.1 alpha/beta hydrolase [Paenibacillus dendritiformis]